MSETEPQLLDLRTPLFGAQAWCVGLVEQVRDDQLDATTPCTEFDVRSLMAHIGLVFEKLKAFGEIQRDPRFGEAMTPETLAAARAELAAQYVDDLSPAQRADQLRGLAQATRRSWTESLLDEPIQLAWGPLLPGRAVAAIYLMECVAHGWDLETATGQDPEAPPEVAEPALAVALRGLPESPRGMDAGVPFGPVVPSRDDAGPTERMANWTGRVSQG